MFLNFVGSTYLDEHNETTLAVLHWKEAHEIRSKDSGYIGIEPVFPLKSSSWLC